MRREREREKRHTVERVIDEEREREREKRHRVEKVIDKERDREETRSCRPTDKKI